MNRQVNKNKKKYKNKVNKQIKNKINEFMNYVPIKSALLAETLINK